MYSFSSQPTVVASAVLIQVTIQVIMAEHSKLLLVFYKQYRLKEELDNGHCHENEMINQKSLQCVNRARDNWHTEITEHLAY